MEITANDALSVYILCALFSYVCVANSEIRNRVSLKLGTVVFWSALWPILWAAYARSLASNYLTDRRIKNIKKRNLDGF